MSVQDVAEHVVEMLIRADFLFTAPTGTEASQLTAAIGDASEASRAIGVRTDELGGALAAAHHDMLDAVGRRLDAVGDNDSRLIETLAGAADAHASDASHATELRQEAEDLRSRLGPAGESSAAELAALLAMRNRVAGMQRLIAEHTSEAARAADVIGALGYQR